MTQTPTNNHYRCYLPVLAGFMVRYHSGSSYRIMLLLAPCAIPIAREKLNATEDFNKIPEKWKA
jgi:hypothetical protein